MPPFGVCIKLKTTGKGYVSSPFLLPEYRKYASNPLLAFRLSREKVGLSTAPLYCPLEIQAEPQIYETDWDAPYEDDLEVIPSSCACGCEDEINAAIEKYSEPEEKHRGLMVYYDANSPVNEKVVSAFPSVEVRNGELTGVLTCRLTEPLTESEMAEFKDWWTGQASDGWAEGFEQKEIKTDAFGTIYVSFWNSSDSWQIEVEMMDETNDIEEEESLDMGGISM